MDRTLAVVRGLTGAALSLAWKVIWKDRARFLVTTAGVGFAGVLALFLFAVYQGVKAESNGYVADRPTDVWVAQANATNLIKSNSLIPADRVDALRDVPGVASVAPLLRTIATVRLPEETLSMFVLGIDPEADATVPAVVEGSGRPGPGGIVLDRAFAAKHGFSVGDTIRLQDRSFRVAGLSTGTNALLAQFSFVTMEEARRVAGLPTFVSFWLVEAAPGVSGDALAARIRRAVPSLNAIPSAEFSDNNLREIRTGVLPILWIVAVLGAVTGGAVLTLLLYGGILERRSDYALLKALGAGQRFVDGVVLGQSLLTVASGALFALLGYAAVTPVLVRLVPELALDLTLPIAGAVLTAMVLLGVVGAWLPIRKLRGIYPGEVFRA